MRSVVGPRWDWVSSNRVVDRRAVYRYGWRVRPCVRIDAVLWLPLRAPAARYQGAPPASATRSGGGTVAYRHGRRSDRARPCSSALGRIAAARHLDPDRDRPRLGDA